MSKKFTLRELSVALLCEMRGDPEFTVNGVDALLGAQENDLSFYANESFSKAFEKTKAGIICVKKEYEAKKGRNYLISDDPDMTFQKAVEMICEDPAPSGFKGIHPTAVVHQSAKIGKNVEIGPYVVIDKDVIIDDHTTIFSHVSIGTDVKIGRSCLIHPNVVIREKCVLHDRVILQPGVVIGGCGYGYTQNAKNESIKIKHFGNVVLEDDVEIGANTTIDRGRFKETRVGKGAKIDNLVMLAHNTSIGENTLVIAQAGIAGSTSVGKNCIIAAQAGLVGHLRIEDQVVIAAQSGVGKSILKPGFYGSGFSVLPIDKYRRRTAHVNRLDNYVEQLKLLKKRVEELEGEKNPKEACQVRDS